MNYLTWRADRLREEDGVVVGADLTQEWLLPWWWKRYSAHNSHPVAFIDFGMSFEKKEWCKKRGELVPLRVFEDFVAQKEEMDPEMTAAWEREFNTGFWNCRSAWFRKPMAFLQTPFKRSVWIDLDCEIKGSIAPLFSYAEEFALAIERSALRPGLDFTIYNSGVVPYRRNLELFAEWGRACIEKNNVFPGDQDVLSYLIAEKKLKIAELPQKYNWSRILNDSEEAVIVHWHGDYGKAVIRNQVHFEEL